ncbi:hypothetical protein LR48_Vigan02g014900 [Vigna angularis]|uniref:Uncharacterized protein n=1 Tax=Phaseolus angularis TaxID=3914 RepID=A0A0L9TV19_PHAAN|nr:hypothetical protein LR48_Vigan02g014900 [Vigna angularis]
MLFQWWEHYLQNLSWTDFLDAVIGGSSPRRCKTCINGAGLKQITYLEVYVERTPPAAPMVHTLHACAACSVSSAAVLLSQYNTVAVTSLPSCCHPPAAAATSTKEQHRNTKLMNALLRLHREISPKLAACAADLISPYPDYAVGYGAVCHLIASALAFWPVHGWSPGLFNTLLASVQSSSLLTLGPKETCSLLYLLSDLFPEEDVWLWTSGMPLLTARRMLGIGTILGPQKERHVNWYLDSGHLEKLVGQLVPHLDKIAEIIEHYAISALGVIQDLLRVFVIRISCHNPKYASMLVKPVLSSIIHHVSESSSPSDTDAYKILRLLDFLVSLLEHPLGKVLPVGKELLACLTAFKELASCGEGQVAFGATYLGIHSLAYELDPQKGDRNVNYSVSSVAEWRKCPPLLSCWMKLLKSMDDTKEGLSTYAIEAVYALSVGSIQFCMNGDSLNSDRVVALKYLFGILDDMTRSVGFPEENINYILQFSALLSSKAAMDDCLVTSYSQIPLHQVSESVKSLSLVLESPAGSMKFEDAVLPQYEVLVFSNTNQLLENSVEKIDDHLYVGGLGEKFLWECPEVLPDRLTQTNLAAKRKLPSMDGAVRRARGESFQGDISSQNAFSRGAAQSTVSSGTTRRDAFRHRKPNTSRPPSMHVDDYVARERIVEGVTNVISVPRAGSTGGRPPSIHVDEFMARQRERQNPSATVVGEAVGHLKNASPVKPADMEKLNKSKQLKTDLDDDLQGIDIVFDGEESDPDDKLLFPQLDDNLQQPAPVIVEQSSPHSIVEETGSDVVDSGQFSQVGTPLRSNIDENAQSEFSSKISGSRPDMSLTRESSVSSDRKYVEQPDDLKNVQLKPSGRYDSTASNTSFPMSLYNNPSSSMQIPADSRMVSQNYLLKNSPQHGGIATGSQGLYDQRFLPNQPPLPPMPPPPTVSPIISHATDSVPSQSTSFVNSQAGTQRPVAFQVQLDYPSPFNNGSTATALASSIPMPDSKYSRTSVSSPGGPNRVAPPLPPTPPPFISSQYNLSSIKTSGSQPSMYNQTSMGTTELSQASIASSGVRLSSYPNPPMGFSRPASMPLTMFGNAPNQQQTESQPNILQNVSVPPASYQSMHSVTQLQPLQPPQLTRPPQPPQLRPPVQALQQLEQAVAVQSNVQVHQMNMLQQSHVPSMQTYYQTQQQQFSHEQLQPHVEYTQQPGDGQSQQQPDAGMSLHEYFKSPEAIQVSFNCNGINRRLHSMLNFCFNQTYNLVLRCFKSYHFTLLTWQSLLRDRDKLCQLLEQHPKLMQMLQVVF